MESYRFAHCASVYHAAGRPAGRRPEYKRPYSGEDGLCDVTDRLRAFWTASSQSRRCGIVLIPEGDYAISRTVYPRAVRMIGFGQKKGRGSFCGPTPPAFRRRRKRTRAKPPTFSGSPATCRASTGRFRTRTPAPLQRRLEHRFLHWAGKPGRRRAARSFCTALLRLPLCFRHRRGQGRHFRCGKRDGKPRVPRRRLRHLHHKVLARLALRLGQAPSAGSAAPPSAPENAG